MKVLLLTTVLLGLWGMQPSLAKQARPRHVGHADVKGAPVHHGGASKGTNSSGGSSNNSITVMPSPPALGSERRHEEKPSVGIIRPENPRPGLPKPSVTVERNAIGQTITRPLNPTGDGQHTGSPSNTATMGLGEPRAADAGGVVHTPDVARQNFRPLAGGIISRQGKIAGARLSSPASALSGLGGPAKQMVGINGTTLRRER